MKKLILIRHGESEWNKLNLFTGWTDVDLSPKGLEEAFEELNAVLQADLKPRSLRLNSSRIEPSHKILRVANDMGLKLFGSPTLSDQALIHYPSVKIGPGDSARSHTADEFIYLEEIERGVEFYIELLTTYFDTEN